MIVQTGLLQIPSLTGMSTGSAVLAHTQIELQIFCVSGCVLHVDYQLYYQANVQLNTQLILYLQCDTALDANLSCSSEYGELKYSILGQSMQC